MAVGSLVRRGLAVALLVACSCSKIESMLGSKKPEPKPANADASLAPAAARPVAAKPAAKKPEDRAAPAASELPATAARGALLQRLPKSTLLAVRMPKVELLKEAWKRTPLSDLFDLPQFKEQRAQMDAGLAQMEGEMTRKFADFPKLKEKVLGLGGEGVFALVSLDALALMKKGGDFDTWPFSIALMFEAGPRAADLDLLLQRLFTAMDEKNQDAGRSFAVVATSGSDWRRRMETEGGRVDISREGTQFILSAGPAAGPGDAPAFPPRALDDSFVAADIVRATPDLSKSGSQPVAEVFLNLGPVWSAVELLAPAEAKNILSGTGATSIAGIGVAAGLGKTGIDEVLMFLSPGGKDLLTQVLTNRPLDPKLARYVPADSKMAALSTFDIAALVDGVTKLLPPNERKMMDTQLAEMRKQGFDLRGDLLGNIGPTFGIVGNVDFMKLFAGKGGTRGALDFTLLVELQDGSRLRRLVDRVMRSSGAAAHARPGVVQGVSTTSLEEVPLPGPDGELLTTIEPSWHIADRALVFSTSGMALERALAAGAKADNRGPAAMSEALAKPAALFSVTSMATDGGPAATSIGRRTGLGLDVTSREGPGTTTAYLFTAGVGAVAAVAIPNLMSQRLGANEDVAVATLRAIAAAQAQFRATALVDQDADGRGEFGTLAELCGSSSLQGGRPPLDPPLLTNALNAEGQGCFSRAGYYFRIDLPRKMVGGPDLCEEKYVAYAWPIASYNTGGKVYVLGADGKIFFSDNRGEGQGYQALQRVPAADASELRNDADRVVGVTAVRRGRDGGIWLELE